MRSWPTMITVVAATLAVTPASGSTGHAEGQVVAAFAFLAPDAKQKTRPYARVIVRGASATCPTLIPTPTGAGVKPVTMSARKNPAPHHFPVSACEAVIDFGTVYDLPGFEHSIAAVDLLPSAPWVFTRGNHELCSRAGIGWFYLLDAGSNLPDAAYPQRECPSQGSVVNPDTDVLSHLVLIEPAVVDLENLRVAVLDSAGACDNFAPTATTRIAALDFTLLGKLLDGGDSPTWLMTHRPIWGATDGTLSGSVQWINQTLQQGLAQASSQGLPPSVSLSLSGHMHLFESSVSTDGSRPPQIVIGNSGVSLAKHKYGDCFEFFDSKGNTGADFGYLSTTIGAEGDWLSWSGEVLGPKSSRVAQCAPGTLGGICARPSKPCDFRLD